MNENNELPALLSAYQQLCRDFDRLKNEASQDNASARMAFDQCNIALQDCKATIAHFIDELHRTDSQGHEYYQQAVRQALQTFKELLRDAEIKVKSARPMPPFMY